MDINHEIITDSAQATAKVGEALAHGLAGRIICLYGDLGSGKTTFTQGFAKGLGIATRLLSPTFIIVRRYDIPSSGKSEKFFYQCKVFAKALKIPAEPRYSRPRRESAQ